MFRKPSPRLPKTEGQIPKLPKTTPSPKSQKDKKVKTDVKKDSRFGDLLKWKEKPKQDDKEVSVKNDVKKDSRFGDLLKWKEKPKQDDKKVTIDIDATQALQKSIAEFSLPDQVELKSPQQVEPDTKQEPTKVDMSQKVDTEIKKSSKIDFRRLAQNKIITIALPVVAIAILLGLSRIGIISNQIFLFSALAIIGIELFLYVKQKKSILQSAKLAELSNTPEQIAQEALQQQEQLPQKISLDPSYLDSVNEVPHFVTISDKTQSTSQYYTVVIKDPTAESGLRYTVVEPSLTDADKANFAEIKKILINELTVDLNKLKNKDEAEEFLKSKILEVIEKYNLQVAKESLPKLYYYAVRDYIKMGKIEALLHDHMIEDISCDGVSVPLYIWHREYESIPTNVMFESEKELDDFVMRMAYRAGRHISLATPIVDASLPDGSRVQITYGYEVTKKGSTFTIRKFRADPLTVVDLIIFNTMSADIAAYLWYMVEKRLTLLVAGGTASGKTTTLNGIGTFIAPGQKVVSIEDTQEINLLHENWIPAVSRQAFISGDSGEITLFDLLRASLRQRPDIIIVGEVRGAEAYTLFQAMATGHGGFSSIHADSIKATMTRLTSEPMKIPSALISNSLDLVLLQLKLKLGTKSVRRILQIAEIVGVDETTGEFIFNDAFKWDPARDLHVSTGRSIAFEKIRKRYGEKMEHIVHAINKRKAVLEWMVRNNIRRHKEVSEVIAQFYSNPDGFYEKIRMNI